MTWWAAYTESGQEKRLKQELKARGVVAFCPFERIRARRKVGHLTRRVTTDRPLFPRYLFIDCDDPATLYNTPGLAYVLGDGDGNPESVRPAEMQALLDSAVAGGPDDGLVSELDRTRMSLGFHARVGDRVLLTGALTGVCATVTSLAKLDAYGMVGVNAPLFGLGRDLLVPYQNIGVVTKTVETLDPRVVGDDRRTRKPKVFYR